jgi:ATP-dependent DNA helicase RecG
LELLKINNKMTREDLAKQIGVSRDTIKYHITNLQTEKRLQRVGGRKEGYWEVLKDNTTI